MHVITVDMVDKSTACSWSKSWFRRTFPDGFELTAENIQRELFVIDWNCAAVSLLNHRHLRMYRQRKRELVDSGLNYQARIALAFRECWEAQSTYIPLRQRILRRILRWQPEPAAA
jgi:hypothetical protein